MKFDVTKILANFNINRVLYRRQLFMDDFNECLIEHSSFYIAKKFNNSQTIGSSLEHRSTQI